MEEVFRDPVHARRPGGGAPAPRVLRGDPDGGAFLPAGLPPAGSWVGGGASPFRATSQGGHIRLLLRTTRHFWVDEALACGGDLRRPLWYLPPSPQSGTRIRRETT